LFSLWIHPAAAHSGAPKLNIFHAEASRFDDSDSASTFSPEAATVSLPSARIIGGKTTAATRYPYLVSLQKTFRRDGLTYYAHICGGTLIAPDVVLTAAHCFDCQGATKCYNRVALGRHDFRSYTEMTYVSNVESGYAQGTNGGYDGKLIFDASEVKEIKHPGYKYNLYTNDIGYDFALIVLPSRANSLAATGAALQPVRLNTDPSIPSGPISLTVAGWGATQTPTPQDNYLSPILLDTTVGYVNNNKCVQAGGYVETNGVNVYYSYWNFVKENMMCAVTANQDACVGDSGGPILLSGPKGDGSDDVQLGIVSFGVGCANADFPGIYARISDQWRWLEETVCEETRYTSVNFQCSTSAPSLSPSALPSVEPTLPPSATVSAAPSSSPTQPSSGSLNNETSDATGSIATPLANDADSVEADEMILGFTNVTHATTNPPNNTTQAPTFARQGANPFDPTNTTQFPTMQSIPVEGNSTEKTENATISTVGPTPSLNISVPTPIDGSTTSPTSVPVESSATGKPSLSSATNKPSEQSIPASSPTPSMPPVVVTSSSPSLIDSPPPSKMASEKPSVESAKAAKAAQADSSGASFSTLGATQTILLCLAASVLLLSLSL